MPVYQLLGGKCRERSTATRTRAATTSPRSIESAKKHMADGFRHVRVQVGVPGHGGYGAGRPRRQGRRPPPRASLRARGLRAAAPQAAGAPAARSSATRSSCCTTSTSASRPSRRSHCCKDAEKFRLFFLEDPLSPEDIGWFRLIRRSADPARDGRAVQQPARVDPAHLPSGSSTTSASTSRRPAASRRAARSRRSASSSASRRPGTVPATSPRSGTLPTSRSIWPATNFGIQESSHLPRARPARCSPAAQ